MNSVLMEGVVVEDNCHLQGSVVGPGCRLQEGASLKDCQVGALGGCGGVGGRRGRGWGVGEGGGAPQAAMSVSSAVSQC